MLPDSLCFLLTPPFKNELEVLRRWSQTCK